MKGKELMEVWIAEKYLNLNSQNYLHFIKGLLMGLVPFKLDLA
jgi:hypothetical protein